MVHVAFTEIHDLDDASRALLPATEINREFGSDGRRRQFQSGRALLRLMLQQHTGKPAPSHELRFEDGGKPHCVDGPAISIAHTSNRVVCCVADDGLVGVDIEPLDESRDMSRIADRFFSSEERNWLTADPELRFYMLWVLKEAFVKAHGQSIFGGLEKLHCTVEPPVITARADEGGFFDLGLYRGSDNLIAIATTHSDLDDMSLRVWKRGTQDLLETGEYSLVATARAAERAQ